VALKVKTGKIVSLKYVLDNNFKIKLKITPKREPLLKLNPIIAFV
jgi:hypothetical protein